MSCSFCVKHQSVLISCSDDNDIQETKNLLTYISVNCKDHKFSFEPDEWLLEQFFILLGFVLMDLRGGVINDNGQIVI